jgi:hypothetical protein
MDVTKNEVKPYKTAVEAIAERGAVDGSVTACSLIVSWYHKDRRYIEILPSRPRGQRDGRVTDIVERSGISMTLLRPTFGLFSQERETRRP